MWFVLLIMSFLCTLPGGKGAWFCDTVLGMPCSCNVKGNGPQFQASILLLTLDILAHSSMFGSSLSMISYFLRQRCSFGHRVLNRYVALRGGIQCFIYFLTKEIKLAEKSAAERFLMPQLWHVIGYLRDRIFFDWTGGMTTPYQAERFQAHSLVYLHIIDVQKRMYVFCPI